MDGNGSVEALYSVRKRLNYLHGILRLSWRTIAATGEFNGISHTTLRDIALGHEPSLATYRALGIRKTAQYTVAFRFADAATADAFRQAIDAHGSRRAVAEGIAAGALVITNGGE